MQPITSGYEKGSKNVILAGTVSNSYQNILNLNSNAIGKLENYCYFKSQPSKQCACTRPVLKIYLKSFASSRHFNKPLPCNKAAFSINQAPNCNKAALDVMKHAW